MNSRERIMAALNGEAGDRPPWMEIGFCTDVASALLGEEFGYSSKSNFFPRKDTGEYRKELSKWIKLAKKINLDVLSMKNWGVKVAESGVNYDFSGTIASLEDWENAVSRVSVEKWDSHPSYACAEILIKEARKEGIATCLQTKLCGFPNVWQTLGFKNLIVSLYRNRRLIEHMLDFYAGMFGRIIKRFLELDPDFIVIGEDLAYGHGPIVPVDKWMEIFHPRYKAAAKKIACPWVLHSDGNILPIMESLIESGLSAIHPIEPYAMDIIEVKKKYGDRICLCGNVDINTISMGSPEDIEKEVKRLYENVGRDGGWIMSSSNSIAPGSKAENVLAMGKTLERLQR